MFRVASIIVVSWDKKNNQNNYTKILLYISTIIFFKMKLKQLVTLNEFMTTLQFCSCTIYIFSFGSGASFLFSNICKNRFDYKSTNASLSFLSHSTFK